MSDGLAERLQTSLGDAFTVERELGGGGMARVFLARDRALDRSVVIKALDIEGGATASAERFRREIQVIARLQHPHIVPVLTAGGTGTLLWYAMPYVSGESLRARLVREGALPLDVTLRIAREVLDALGYAHGQGFVHRDVKPENILLEAGHAVVADFGVAKALADAGVSGALTSAGLALGTPTYMAPEQAMADPTTNHRADLYAVGAVMYEMLVGAPPYSGNAQAVIAAHLTAPVPRVEERRGDVPASVAQLIAGLLAKNPAERPQSAADALRTLDTMTTPGGTPVGAATPAGGASPSLAQRAAIGARTAGAAAIGGLVDGPAGEALKGIVSGELGAKSSRGRLLRNVALAALLAGSIWFWKARKAGSQVVEGADVIAVMPLGTSGDSAMSRLGRDLVVTISANLDGVGALRTLDAMTVLMRTQKLPQPLPLADARKLAGDLGARSVVHGSLVPEAGGVRASVALYRVGTDEPLVRATAVAPAADIRSLTDSLTWQLLRGVWRKGTAPSPFLSNVATPSMEALRAFLDGEAKFEKLDVTGAMDAYKRATDADSNFAQAFLRRDWLRGWALEGVDSVARARLMALKGRLSDRERRFVEIRARAMALVERIDSLRALANAYPDFPLAQYTAADAIIHGGPVVGVPIADAKPFLARLDALAPDHLDNIWHAEMVAAALDDSAEVIRRVVQAEKLGPNNTAFMLGEVRRTYEAHAAGRAVPDPDSTFRVYQSFAEYARERPGVAWAVGLLPIAGPAHQAGALATARARGALAGFEPQADFGEGVLSVARGEYAEGLAVLERLEVANAPDVIQLSAVRAAAVGAWLGGVSHEVADGALARVRSRGLKLSSLSTAELQWLDGIIGLAADDSARVAGAAQSIVDTSHTGRNLARSLRALWRERRGGGVDSLIALEDDAMRTSTTFSAWLPIHRMLIGRALVRQRDPIRAEHYLQWTDALVTGARPLAVSVAFGPLNAYQRGLAFEAAGDRRHASIQYHRFIDNVDHPPPGFRAQVDDAKARLTKLTGDARK